MSDSEAHGAAVALPQNDEGRARKPGATSIRATVEDETTTAESSWGSGVPASPPALSTRSGEHPNCHRRETAREGESSSGFGWSSSTVAETTVERCLDGTVDLLSGEAHAAR